jgi:hypothetical protein
MAIKLHRCDPCALTFNRFADGPYVAYKNIQPEVDRVFAEYESTLKSAISTGLLEGKEIEAMLLTIKNLKRLLTVETAV